MSNQTHRTGRALGTALALVFVAALALAAGAYWHAPIARALGSEPARPAPSDQPEQLWTCSMHPQIIRKEPGLCPICHMQLVPLNTQAGAGDQAVTIEPSVVQNMGVRTQVVERGPLESTIRAAGSLAEREPDQTEINLRVAGWIEHLYASTDGMLIRKGEPLFDLYSPDLALAIEELIAARKEAEHLSSDDETARKSAASLRDSASAKLIRLGLTAAQAQELGGLDAAPRIVTFLSPRGGHIRDLAMLSNGSAVQPGQRILRILDPSTLWLEARVPEHDMGRLRIGQRAQATIDAFPGREFTGVVSFVHPHLDEATRTAIVRLNIDNEDQTLRQGMFASVRIRTDPGPETVLAPREAVIDAGERQIAFVDLGGGRFEPRQVRTGAAGDDGRIQVLSGLSTGDRVVVSGQFLLDSESRLREAVRKYTAPGTPPVAEAPPAPTTPATLIPRIDAVFAAYLPMAAALGRPQESENSLDPAPLIVAAKAMSAAAASSDDRNLAAAVQDSAQAMTGRTLAEQRERFQALSTAMVKLAAAHPPTARALGGAARLYQAHCPMVNSDWLQTSSAVANPFYATDMKQCGEIVREIPLTPGAGHR